MANRGPSIAFPDSDGPLKILHVLRAPLGGLFRHVIDLAKEQAARGHLVGLVCDSTTGGVNADKILRELVPSLKLGITRTRMSRNPAPSDISALWHIMKRTKALKPDVVHGHGSKGGFYARLPGCWSKTSVRAYTPHGGSFNFKPGTRLHSVYMAVEKFLKRGTDIFLFESGYIASRFRASVGETRALSRVVWNGIARSEFTPVVTNPDAVDFLYIGELRAAKGIDTFIEAIAELDRTTPFRPRAIFAGTGPDRAHLMMLVMQRGLDNRIRFAGALPARTAFQSARILVVPSRAESLPYVVLEAAGAQIPIVSTNVGGIPEIFGPFSSRLFACNDATIMAEHLAKTLRKSPDERATEAEQLAQFVVGRFTISHMVDAVVGGYHDALAARQRSHSKVSSKTSLIEGH